LPEELGLRIGVFSRREERGLPGLLLLKEPCVDLPEPCVDLLLM
jgi:hypothetical protein